MARRQLVLPMLYNTVVRSVNSSEYIEKFINCLSKNVRIKTKTDTVYEGWFETVDPLTGTICLVNYDANRKMKNSLFFTPDEYCDVEVTDEKESTDKILENSALCKYRVGKCYTSRMLRLSVWLDTHEMPVRMDDSYTNLIVCESVFIKPPYGVENCFSHSHSMLELTCHIVRTLPEHKGLKELRLSSRKPRKRRRSQRNM